MDTTPLRGGKPPWLKARFPSGERFTHITDLLRGQSLHTVCEEAHCPNIGECFNSGTATFMILGDTCTRACGFCAVNSGRPEGLDLLEPYRLAQTVQALGLDYVVITSVNRDDLPDGGAERIQDGVHAFAMREITNDNRIVLRAVVDRMMAAAFAKQRVFGGRSRSEYLDVAHRFGDVDGRQTKTTGSHVHQEARAFAEPANRDERMIGRQIDDGERGCAFE